MAKVIDIDKALCRIAPMELSEQWDNDGIMLCKDKNAETRKVLVMLDVSEKGVDYAIENDFDMIITHHPFIFKPLTRIVEGNYRVVEKLVKNNICVLSYHTRMDSADGGVNTALAELLCLENVTGFGAESGGLGKLGELKKDMTPEEFAQYLKQKLGCGNIRASFFKQENRKIKKVAVIGGAGKSFYKDAFFAGADAYVTSEAAHNTFIECRELDMCLYDCGHYYTENPVCLKFKKILEESFKDDLVAEIYNVESPYVNL